MDERHFRIKIQLLCNVSHSVCFGPLVLLLLPVGTICSAVLNESQINLKAGNSFLTRRLRGGVVFFFNVAHHTPQVRGFYFETTRKAALRTREAGLIAEEALAGNTHTLRSSYQPPDF